MRIRPFIRSMQLDRERVPDFEQYPFCIPAVKGLGELHFHEKVTFLTGENGMGKSTLMEALALACGLCPEGGSRHFLLETRATHSCLHEYLRLERGPLPPRDGYFLRAESYYNVATYIEELDKIPAAAPPVGEAYGGSLHECSHGESFFALLNHRLGSDGLYLFDEPEAALSPMRQMSMLARFHQMAGTGCQLIIATHSPILMAYPDSLLYWLGEDGIRQTTYEETEHVLLTRRFLEDPGRMMRKLMDGEEQLDN